MSIGDVIEYNNVKLRVEKEKSEFSCLGCYLSVNCSKGRTGCTAKSSDRMFDNCKREHLIFVRV